LLTGSRQSDEQPRPAARANVADGYWPRRWLHRVLGTWAERHLLRWKYPLVLLHAGFIHELELLCGDFTTCATLDELEGIYGFDLDYITERWERHRDQQSDINSSPEIVRMARLFRKPDEHDVRSPKEAPQQQR
jgi:hypothetical protein